MLNLRPYLMLGIASLCWAGNVVLARGVADTIPPAAFAFWRWLIAFLLILPFTLGHSIRDRHAIGRSWKILFILSLLGISGFNALLYTAVHTTTAVNAALIQSAMPATIVLLCLLIYREKISGRQAAGILLCVLGVCLIVLKGDLRTLLSMDYARGDLLMIIAMLSYGLYSALLRRRPGIHPSSFLLVTFLFGTIGLLPVYLAELFARGPFALTRETALSILYVALFPSIVAYFCWNKGVDKVGPNHAGLFINLIPVFAFMLSAWFLREPLQFHHLGGLALIFSGMLLFYFSRA